MGLRSRAFFKALKLSRLFTLREGGDSKLQRLRGKSFALRHIQRQILPGMRIKCRYEREPPGKILPPRATMLSTCTLFGTSIRNSGSRGK